MVEGLALHWRLIPPRYNLVGSECKNCREKFFPPRNICPECRRKSKIERLAFTGRGEVYSYSVVRAAPVGFEYQVPYVVAIVNLEEGAMCTSQIVDCSPEDVKVGSKVKMVFRKIIADNDSGIIKYGYKFKLDKK
ncbi:MAG: transcriptional regulator [Candidatus Altiarchaeales archaeon]|nr:transcriptional regulator [Candidatus Altiarchaeales archaeon]MBD3415608.1 transcriptional regulator [Candidatus Altiarchaeales archaeon]